MLIEIFADFSCPWCYIGRRRLARAQALRPHLAMQTVWQPFQLDPDLPPEGMDRTAYLRAKFGDVERVRTMQVGLVESAPRRRAFASRFSASAARPIRWPLTG